MTALDTLMDSGPGDMWEWLHSVFWLGTGPSEVTNLHPMETDLANDLQTSISPQSKQEVDDLRHILVSEGLRSWGASLLCTCVQVHRTAIPALGRPRQKLALGVPMGPAFPIMRLFLETHTRTGLYTIPQACPFSVAWPMTRSSCSFLGIPFSRVWDYRCHYYSQL